MSSVIIAALLSLPLSFSGPGDVDLRWEAPAGCPDREQMLARLVVPPGPGAMDPVEVSAVVQERDPGHWLLELELRTPSGTSHRRVDATDCRTLAETTTIVTAVYLGGHVAPELPAVHEPAIPRLQRPRVAVDAPRPEPDTARADLEPHPTLADESTPVDSRAREPSLTRERGSRRDPIRDLRAAIYLAGGAGLGVLPQVDLTTTAGVGVFGPRWRVELAASRWFPRQEDTAAGVGVDVDMWSGRVSAGPRFRLRKLSFPILADVELGAMHGQGVGASLVRRDEAWAPWVAAGLTAGLSWGLHRNVALWARASGLISLYRPHFLVTGVGSAYVAGAGGGRVCAGFEVRFPGISESARSKLADVVTNE